MDLKFDAALFDKKVDPESGSILFYRKDKRGIPDRVIEGEGFTVEIKDDQLYLIDVFDSQKVFGNLLRDLKIEEAV